MKNKKLIALLLALLAATTVAVSAWVGSIATLQDTARREIQAICGGVTATSTGVADTVSASINLNPTGTYVTAGSDTPKLNFTYFRTMHEFDWKRKERENNLQRLYAAGLARGLTLHELQALLATPMQETKGINTPGGDLDSMGLYQMRPGIKKKDGSYYWGSPTQLMNPEYVANRFIDEMFKKMTRKQLAATPIKEIAIAVEIPNRVYYDRDWARYGWDKLAASLVGSKEFNGEVAQQPLQDDLTLGGDSDGCESACFMNAANFASVDTISIATWNREYGNSGSKFRAGLAAVAQRADIIGMQEMGDGQWFTAKKLLSSKFKIVDERNAVPIFYNPKKFEYLDSGEDKTSGGVHVESGAGGRYFSNKNITWVKLKVKSTGSVIYMVNHHLVPTYEKSGKLDHNKPLRIALYKKQMNALFDLVQDFSKEGPVFISADWNYDAKADARVKSQDGLYEWLGRHNLFSNWRSLGFTTKQGSHGDRYIDYIAALVTKAAKPVAQTVLSNFGSDHRPVIVTYKGEATVVPDKEVAKVTAASLQNNQPQSQIPAPKPTPTPTPSSSTSDGGGSDGSTESDDPGCGDGSDGGILAGTNLQKMFDFATAQIGKQYVFGAVGPNVFDCSGLTLKAFAAAGVKLPRTSQQQYAATKKYAVSKGQLRKGDLVFFHILADSQGGANHVGIYWGDNKMLHASRPGKPIKIVDMGGPDDYYWSQFLGGSRPLQTVVSAGPSTGTTGWGFPLKQNYAISSPYGMRTHPVTGQYKLHDGTDYGARTGTAILAAADGVVTSARYQGAYGNYVTISHDGGKVITGYAHMSSIATKQGQTVRKGQVIGYVGSTGAVTGAHLHFNVRVKGYHTPECPTGGGSKCNSYDNWVNSDKFIKNTKGFRDQLLGTKNVFVDPGVAA